MQFPKMIRVRQTFDCPRVDDIPGTVEAELSKLQLSRKVRAGQSIAITAGSRGIANIATITRAIVDHCNRLGAKPFIVPAMGSHGGGTAEGQAGILAGYGITAESMGCPVRASMETVIVDSLAHGVPVHFDRIASEADHVIVVGRIKPHTGFVGEIESGLHKMMLIGLGKHEGAKIYHRAIMDYSWLEIVEAVAGSVLKKCHILCGVGIVENAYDETALIEAVAPEEFGPRERALLRKAREWMPRLPFTKVDLLIVDEIGKNISGSGMDTNVVGRKYNDHKATEKDDYKVRTIFVRGLSEETHGNACGIGMCEFTNQRTVDAIDKKITAINAITGGHCPIAMVPIHYDTDREVLEQALTTVGLVAPENARVVQISNTLHLREVLVSEVHRAEISSRSDLAILGDAAAMAFDPQGNLLPVAGGH